jgi:LmbE family N-acetylglucosaminyl deacetylase
MLKNCSRRVVQRLRNCCSPFFARSPLGNLVADRLPFTSAVPRSKALLGTLLTSERALVVAAHPDDETIGAGALLSRISASAHLLHVTDGAPRVRRWWGAPELPSREAYARVRREELSAALALAGVPEKRVRSLGIPDQEASLDLVGLARRVAGVLGEVRPEVVLTHPYEGGHPDHDAAAFAVHAACRVWEQEGATPPRIVEFTSYHVRADGGLAVCEFLPAKAAEEVTLPLTIAEREMRRRMLAAFTTQRETLAPFSAEVERFRAAPAYDFTAPPHHGMLHYEQFEWGCTGPEWRARAREALAALGLEVEAPC